MSNQSARSVRHLICIIAGIIMLAMWSERAIAAGQVGTIYRSCSATTCNEFTHASSALLMDIRGKLYGAAASGGPNNGGFVFELSPDTTDGTTHWKLHVLYNFCWLDDCAD